MQVSHRKHSYDRIELPLLEFIGGNLPYHSSVALQKTVRHAITTVCTVVDESNAAVDSGTHLAMAVITVARSEGPLRRNSTEVPDKLSMAWFSRTCLILSREFRLDQ